MPKLRGNQGSIQNLLKDYVSLGLEMPLSRPKSGGGKVNLGYLQKFLYRNENHRSLVAEI